LQCMRGAGRYGYSHICRGACRRRRQPVTVSENLGFRCAAGATERTNSTAVP
jgi:formylglycine-generating enzyme required for sulfatase activity